MPQRDLFPPNHPTVIEHNITLLTRYYTKTQHDHYKNIINTHFSTEHNRDSRFTPPPINIPHTQIFINECNPEKTSLVIRIPYKLLMNKLIYTKVLVIILSLYQLQDLNGYDNNTIEQITVHTDEYHIRKHLKRK